MKVYMETLGCPKNFNDTQVACGIMEQAGIEIAETAEEAAVIILNTCGFINDAKKESIERIFELAELKGDRRLVMAGCLSQRYSAELAAEMPEVDCFIGVNDYQRLPQILAGLTGQQGGERAKSGQRLPRKGTAPAAAKACGQPVLCDAQDRRGL